MSDPIIQSDSLSKIYRLGSRERENRTFREAFMDALASPVRNLRELRRLTTFRPEETGTKSDPDKKETDFIWALKDVSFAVEEGEVTGIIGKNGAGKSTLLKILSRITEPTSGEVYLHGRVSSLLEVGTGFHPELTGRENIYLNGTILGMRKVEIDRKFDQIVAFSEVEKFLDTPVKRYSSGMYVRLAFAVAAHLESEILLVDEVLAVGDAAFQKKCLGKMSDISSREGRTILFVSHNMPAVRKFCKRGILLDGGQIQLDGDVNTVVNRYLELGSHTTSSVTWDPDKRPGNRSMEIVSLMLSDERDRETSVTNISADLFVRITYRVKADRAVPQFSLMLFDVDGNSVFSSLNNKDNNLYGAPVSKGIFRTRCRIPGNLMNAGRFSISVAGFVNNWYEGFRVENVLSFDAVDDGVLKGDYHGNYSGPVRPLLSWHTEQIQDGKE